MYQCEMCETVVRTRQGLSGHVRFRHEGKGYQPNVRASANPNKIDAKRLERVESKLDFILMGMYQWASYGALDDDYKTLLADRINDISLRGRGDLLRKSRGDAL